MRAHYRILILEDVPQEAVLVERALKKANLHCKCERAVGREEFIEKLNRFVPDIILSDHALPQFDSIEALKISREYYPDIPFILVTGAVSEEFAVKILKQGADDYILKSNLSRLALSVSQAIKQHRLERKKIEAQQVLHEQNLQLIKLNKELDNFVYSVSHNLRAPLASVMGLISLSFMEKNDFSKLNGYLEMMQHSINKLDNTLKDILAYSRNSRLDSPLEKVDAESLINDCFDNLKYAPNQERLKKRITVTSNLEWFSDTYRINLIFSNLISNSVKYMDLKKEENFVEIKVNVSDVVSIKFSDNGIGIQEKLLPNVFKMFYRATEKSEGAGLGLYIVKEAVEKLNGIIAVESSMGVGTTFTINIPNLINHQLKIPLPVLLNEAPMTKKC